jgi:antitoxin PrlF
MAIVNSDFKREAVVTIDSKGQVVLPKDVREKAGFTANGKIALVSIEKERELCCLLLLKADKLDEPLLQALRGK